MSAGKTASLAEPGQPHKIVGLDVVLQPLNPRPRDQAHA